MAKYQEAAPIILKALEDGATMLEAAKAAGVHKSTLFEWINSKPDFSDFVQCARKEGEGNSISKVEATLLKMATGYEYEDVKTEYASELNTKTGKYEPVIRKQVRIKKNVPANIEAIKFYLSNKAPEQWKNRIEQNNTGNLVTDLQIRHVQQSPDDVNFPSSESEVDAER
jgi:hypothetical protein